MEIAFISVIVLGILLFVVKYPIGTKRDPGSRYYWNLAGIYVKAAYRAGMGNWITIFPDIYITIPFISLFKKVPDANIVTFKVLQYVDEYFSSNSDRNVFQATFAIDHRLVFVKDKPYYPSDPHTFVILAEGQAQDKFRTYSLFPIGKTQTLRH